MTIERAYLDEPGAGCTLPVGAHVDGDLLHVFLADEAGLTAVTRAVELAGEGSHDLETAAGGREAARSSPADEQSNAALHGRRVVTTRDEPGELRSASRGGAEVVHVPLIEIAEPLDGGAELQGVLHVLDDVDWVVVTSISAPPAPALRWPKQF